MEFSNFDNLTEVVEFLNGFWHHKVIKQTGNNPLLFTNATTSFASFTGVPSDGLPDNVKKTFFTDDFDDITQAAATISALITTNGHASPNAGGNEMSLSASDWEVINQSATIVNLTPDEVLITPTENPDRIVYRVVEGAVKQTGTDGTIRKIKQGGFFGLEVLVQTFSFLLFQLKNFR